MHPFELVEPRPRFQVGSEEVVRTGLREGLQHQESRPGREAVVEELVDAAGEPVGLLEDRVKVHCG